MRLIRCIAAGLCAGSLAGCADFAPPVNRSALPSDETRLQAIETKLADIGRRIDNLNQAAQSRESVRLGDEVRGLRGEVENLKYLTESTSKRSQELYVDLDKRIAAIGSAGRPASLAMDNQLDRSALRPSAATPQEEAAYLKAFDQLKAGQHDQAIAGFQEMLSQWPNGRYSDNAQYWIGESYYVKKDYNSALEAFEAVLERFPNSAKAADALFKTGLTQQQLGQSDAAKSSLQKVVQNYPNSSAAALAKARLETLATSP